MLLKASNACGVWCTCKGTCKKAPSRRTWLGLAGKTGLQDLLGRTSADHHFWANWRLLPRRSELDAFRTRTRTGNVLGRFSDALAEYLGSKITVGYPCKPGADCGAVPGQSRGGSGCGDSRKAIDHLDLRN